MHKLLLLLIALSSLQEQSSAQAQEKRFDLTRHVWAKHKLGTYIIYRLKEVGNDGEGLEKFITVRLEKVGATDFTLSETKHDQNGSKRSEQIIGYPLYLKEETVQVNTSRVKCTVWAWTTRGEEGIDKSVIWYGDNLQPQKWKWVRDESGPAEWSRELQLVAKKDRKKLSDKAIECQRMEGTLVTKDRQFKLVEWWSDDVPGGIVGAEIYLGDGPRSAKNVLEAIEMGVSDPKENPPKPPGK